MFEQVSYMENGMIRAVRNGTVLNVPDDQSLAERQEITKWEEEGNTIAPFEPPLPPPYRLAKLTVVTRLTNEEAEQVYPAMAAMPAKLRFVWDTAQSIESDSQFFDDLRGFLAQIVTQERADELLQPEA